MSGQRDVIQFVIGEDGEGGHVIAYRINGRDLIDLVRETEAPSAQAEGHPEIAGGYEPLPAYRAAAPGYFLGERTVDWGGEPATVLMDCKCGNEGCWPLMVQIDMTNETVTWSGFWQWHRPKWSYDSLGPFIFDRHQYGQAVQDLNDSLTPAEKVWAEPETPASKPPNQKNSRANQREGPSQTSCP